MKDMQKALHFLYDGANPNFQQKTVDYPHDSIFIQAVRTGHFGMTGLMLEFGADVNSMSNLSGLTSAQQALIDHRFSHWEQLWLLQMLLKKGCDIEACGSQGITTLMAAVVGGNLDIINWLLQLGANPNPSGPAYLSALHLSVLNVDGRVVDDLTKLQITRRLLDAGADVNARSVERNGETALMMACSLHPNGKDSLFPVIQELIKQGAHVNMKCDQGFKPIQHLAKVIDSDEYEDWEDWDEFHSVSQLLHAAGGSHETMFHPPISVRFGHTLKDLCLSALRDHLIVANPWAPHLFTLVFKLLGEIPTTLVHELVDCRHFFFLSKQQLINYQLITE